MDAVLVLHVRQDTIILIQDKLVVLNVLLAHTVLDMVGQAALTALQVLMLTRLNSLIALHDQQVRSNQTLDKYLEPLEEQELMQILMI